jgi:integrase
MALRTTISDTNRTPGDFKVPKKIDHRDLKSATPRLKLTIAKKPYWLSLAPGIALGYRRNAGVGTWSVRYNGGNGEWLKKIGSADDREKANPDLCIFDFDQAQQAARKLARTQPGVPEDTSRPLTVDEALSQFKQDLFARGGSPYNEKTLRGHVTPSLLSKPVQLLAKNELTTWRNGLIGKLKPSSVNRMCKSFRAALNLAANNDSRIKNRDAWKLGLKGLPGAEEDRNVILDDNTVGSVVLASYERNDALGLFMHVLAETGARPSQAERRLVADLVMTNPKAPRLMMPKSGKGGGDRLARKVERYSVAITPDLAHRLKLAAKGRSSRDRLLLQSNGQPWGDAPAEAYGDDMREVIAGLGLDEEVTPYALRHSSIVRWLLKGINTRVVASAHDTSVAMIEKHYSRHIGDHIPEEMARRAMLQLPVAGGVAENVVALR